MSIYLRVGAFAELATAARSRKRLQSAFESLIAGVGADSFLCAFTGAYADPEAMERSISNLPVSWQRVYLERGYTDFDPIYRSVTVADPYGFWCDMIAFDKLDAPGREVMAYAAEVGMLDGFTHRVELPNRRTAFLIVAGRKLEKSAEVAQGLRWATSIMAEEGLRLLSTMVQPELAISKNLSPAQSQVLMLRADGLSNEDVARKLGTMPKTVESHVTQILRRLNARNMLDAVRIAKQHKLLS